jgi:endoglucanase
MSSGVAYCWRMLSRLHSGCGLVAAIFALAILSGCTGSDAPDPVGAGADGKTCAQPAEKDRAPTCTADYAYLRGVNTQGGGGSQHDPTRVPGTLETDYHFNGQEFYDYLYSRGHRVVRLDFLWERVQPSLGGDLDSEGVAELEAAVQRAADAGLLVLLDMKNYARYWLSDDSQVMFGAGISAEDFADAWGKLAVEFADQPAVTGYGLMNEPWGLPDPPTGRTTVWKEFSQAAVDAIREAGDKRTVFVAGDEWSGAWGWSDNNGEPWIDDPADNVVYEAHIYFDADKSGTYEDTYAVTEAQAVAQGWADLPSRIEDEVDNYTDWLAEHGQRGFIGEIGWPSGPEADQWNGLGDLVYDMLDDAGVGATYWAAGEWLSSDGGMYNQDAYNRDFREPQAQTEVIESEEHLSRAE